MLDKDAAPAPTNPTQDADVALVLAAYHAFARGDIEGAVAGLHPDVEWIEPETFPQGGRYQGAAAVAEYLRTSRARWADLVSEASPYKRGDQIIVLHRVHGTLMDGQAADSTVADVFTVRAGRIVHMQAYADPTDAFSQESARSPLSDA